MTTPPTEPEPPRGGTPLDDAVARDPEDDTRAAARAGIDADADLDDAERGVDPTTEAEDDPRYA
jgi:hypothetical protein